MSKLINYQYLRSETDIDQNVDDIKLDNPIKRATDQLKFLIGRPFFLTLEAQYPSSFYTDNSALYDPYIKQYLAWQSYEYYLIRANLNETRTGLRKFLEENSENLTAEEMGPIVRDAHNQAIFYKGVLLTFLAEEQQKDSTKYPLYTNCGRRTIGTAFGITSVRAKNKVYTFIDNKIINRVD